MNIFGWFTKKPQVKIYKFHVEFSTSGFSGKNIKKTLQEIFYGKTKGEIVQGIKRDPKYKGYKIQNIQVE